jgi:putative transposase
MKKRFSEEQIVAILREAQSGSTVKEVCARHNVSEPTYYVWKRKYAGMEVSDVRKMKAMQEEMTRLKRIIADQAVQIQILQEVNSKKW